MAWQTVEDDPLARGRSRAERTADGWRIVVPAKREWPLLLFLMFWLGGWTVAGVSVIVGLVNGGTEGESAAFSVFWLGGWVLGWCFAASVLGWALLGREIVTVGGHGLTVERVAGPYRRVKRFARERVARVTTEPYRGLLDGLRGTASLRHGMELWGLGGGSIAIDYGDRTHRFAAKLDEPESRRLADLVAGTLGVERQ